MASGFLGTTFRTYPPRVNSSGFLGSYYRNLETYRHGRIGPLGEAIAAIIIKKTVPGISGKFFIGEINTGKTAGRQIIGFSSRQAELAGEKFL